MSDSLGTACFIDSNVWLYGLIESGNPVKSAAARQLIQSVDAVVSQQVVNEVCVNLLKRAKFSEQQIRDVIASFFEKCHVVEITLLNLLAASELRERHSLSYWDSLIVSAALASGANVLYTEDMQHGLTVDGRMQIVSPFQ